ncbi:hypothetical protein qu_642 [Acanthamoeba polyphaga mimivirus]|nr:hypothetical protein [Mimivirus reunion]WMV61976.1 hypothetical protein qu_642 [Mimivirus sp.]WMV62953.1 hypothetical protein qu_642 [Acanthamoeba polyphaga mimivirus]WMV63930.1 hypothetical protein qu_642 [Mimivirus sp.]
MSKNNRKSPSESATLFKVGTIATGHDKNKWIVKETSNGVKRWTKFIPNSNIKIRNNELISFNFNFIEKLFPKQTKHIGDIFINSNKIGVGELLFWPMNTQKGLYNIFNLKGCLIAVHNNVSLFDQKFTISDKFADCDIGMFSFNDYVNIEPYLQKNKIKKSSGFGLKFPEFSTKHFSFTGSKPNYVYLEDLEDFVDDKSELVGKINDPIAVFVDNKFGDGSFPIYVGKNAFFIMNQDIMDTIIDNQ